MKIKKRKKANNSALCTPVLKVERDFLTSCRSFTEEQKDPAVGPAPQLLTASSQ